jgi:beta-lactamase regulating signal transducer with metallopeptidase domain
MNTLLTAFGGWRSIVDAPLWFALLLKVTAILSAAWLAHLALARSNPRWRVFLWRVTAVGLIALPAAAWLLPALQIRVEQPLVAERQTVVSTAAPHLPSPFGRGVGREGGDNLPSPFGRGAGGEGGDNLPSPFGRGAGGEGGGETGQLETVSPRNALTLTLSGHRPHAGREGGLWAWTVLNGTTLLLTVWLAGVAVLVLRLFIGHYRIGRIIGRAKQPTQLVRSECLRVAEAVGCRDRVEVVQSTEIDSPFLCRIRRPLLVLPARMCEASYRRDLPGILAHELTHVRSHDVLWNVGLQLISIVLWFHPLAWRMRKAHLAACELVCDAVSASFVGDVADYCRTLARVAVGVCSPLPAAGIAMARTSAIGRRLSALRRRVFHIPLRRRSVIGFGFVAMLVVAVVGALQLAMAAPPAAGPAAVAVAKTTETPPNPSRASETRRGSADGALRLPSGVKNSVTIEGVVVDERGRPEAGVAVKLLTHQENEPVVESDAQGRFQFHVDSQWLGRIVLARTADGVRQAYYRFAQELDSPRTAPPPIQLTMCKARAIEVLVIDGAGRSVSDAVVGAVVSYEGIDTGRSDRRGNCVLRIPAEARLQNVYAFKSGLGLDYAAFPPKDMASTDNDESHKSAASPSPVLTLSGAKTARIKLVDPEGRPLAGMVIYPWYFEKQDRSHREDWKTLNIAGVAAFHARTDADGVAVFDWLPTWNTTRITFWHREDQARYWARERIIFDPKSGKEDVTVKLVRTVPIGGRVRFADGRPAEGIQVDAFWAGYQGFDGFRGSVRTDADGRFELHSYPDQLCMVAVTDSRWAAAARTGIVVRPDTPVDGVDFQLRPATEIRGQVTIGPDKKPLAGQQVTLLQSGPDNLTLKADERLPNPAGSNRHIQADIVRWTSTDKQGRYAFHVGPGNYVIRGPENVAVQKFSVGGDKPLTFDFHAPRPARGVLAGRVVLQGNDAQPVADAEIVGMSRDSMIHELSATADSRGRFRVERWLDKMWIHARSKDGRLAGVAEIAEEQQEAIVAVKPTASVKGRLLDAATRQPLAGHDVVAIVVISSPHGGNSMNLGQAKTDGKGRFVLGGLATGVEYRLEDVPHEPEDTPPEQQQMPRPLTDVTPKRAEEIDLGDVQSTTPQEYHPPTLKERIAKAFDNSTALDARLDLALNDAQLTRQRVLVVFADPNSKTCEQLYRLWFEDERAQEALADYRPIAVNAKGDKAEEAAAFLKTRLGVRPTDLKQPALLVVDVDGRLLAGVGAEKVSKAERIDRDLLVAFLKTHAPERPDAERLLADALLQAQRENKRVLVQETGAYCGWCFVLSRFLESQREILSPDYVTIKIDRWRFRNGQQVMRRLRTGKDGGIPWMAILDSKGKTLTTSDGPKGNIGYPGEPEEIDFFLKMLAATAQRITPQQYAALRKSLEKRSTKQETQRAKKADAATKTGSMRVQVVSGDGKPIPGASLKAAANDGRGTLIAESLTLQAPVQIIDATGLESDDGQHKITAAKLGIQNHSTKGTLLRIAVVDNAGKPIHGARIKVVGNDGGYVVTADTLVLEVGGAIQAIGPQR